MGVELATQRNERAPGMARAVTAAALLCVCCCCAAERDAALGLNQTAAGTGGRSGAHRKMLFDPSAVSVLAISIFNAFSRFYYQEGLAGLYALLRLLGLPGLAG
jgi:hypothetical protein